MRRTWRSTTRALDVWVYDGKRMPSSGSSAVVGKSKEEFSPEPLNYSEMRPGCYDANARLEDTTARVCLRRCAFRRCCVCGQLFMEASDREFGFQCLQILQRLARRGWCGVAPGDIPLMLIPCGIRALAVTEMERMAAKGVTAFAFSENPEPLGLPTIHDVDGYWDPVMAAANELGLVADTWARRRRCPRSVMTHRSWPMSGASRNHALLAVQRTVPALPEPEDRLVRG